MCQLYIAIGILLSLSRRQNLSTVTMILGFFIPALTAALNLSISLFAVLSPSYQRRLSYCSHLFLIRSLRGLTMIVGWLSVIARCVAPAPVICLSKMPLGSSQPVSFAKSLKYLYLFAILIVSTLFIYFNLFYIYPLSILDAHGIYEKSYRWLK